MKDLFHPNIVGIKEHFYSGDEENKEDVYLNIVMDYVPETVSKVMNYYAK